MNTPSGPGSECISPPPVARMVPREGATSGRQQGLDAVVRRPRSSSPIPHRSSARRRGFTFAELLAAMVFVGVVIPVAVKAIGVANRCGVMAERTRVASELADKLLADLVVTEEWRTGSRAGDFGEDWPGFRWVLDDQPWDMDAMRVVTVEVFFQVQGREYSVRLTTLAQEEEAEETEA